MCGPIVILDISCFRFIRSKEARAKLDRQMEFINATTVGTAVNAIEMSRHGSKAGRAWLREVLGYLAGTSPLMPWPYGLLERVGEAIMAGNDGIQLAPSGLENLLTAEPSQEVLDRADALAKEMEEEFRTINEAGRPQLQRFVRDRGLVGEWTGARDFLDEVWMRPAHIDDYILGVWEKLNLQSPCPVDEVRDNPTWRAFFEAYGVAAYEQAILPNRSSSFGMLDLLQLVYPTGFHNGAIFVTDDDALARAGDLVVSQRVPQARVMRWSDFAAAA